jgi:site-specific DNA recombinase
MTPLLKKAVGYIRVSTREQAEHGYSEDGQDDEIRKYAEYHGYELGKIYKDSGISGSKIDKRLGMQQMLEDAENGEFEVVISWKVSRLARNAFDLLTINQKLKDNNVGLILINENIDSRTRMGEMMMFFTGMFAEIERENIIENVKMGMKKRADSGYKNGGQLLGYKSVAVNEVNTIEVVESEASIVREIYDLYVYSNKGYKAIANYLNKKGYKTKKGNAFSINSIKCILENPTYTGLIRYNYYVDYAEKRRQGKSDEVMLVEGVHEPIIPREIWNQARYIQSQKTTTSTKNSGKYPLTGILKCPECGYGMVASTNTSRLKDGTKRKIRYYSCGQFHNKGSSVCHANSVRADETEQYVFEKVIEFLNDDRLIRAVITKMNTDRHKGIDPLQRRYDKLIEEQNSINKRKDKVYKLYEEEVINIEKAVARIKVIESEAEQLQQNIEDTKAELSLVNMNDVPEQEVRKSFSNIAKVLNNKDPKIKQKIIKLIVKEITVTDKKVENIEITFNPIILGILESSNDIKGEFSSNEDSSSFYEFRAVI